ncbi:hypothetical protein ACPWT1_01545 [Ramlibacter sp. MMS24-I3-19]|uniref:hypothetical protein n=1 Tax=Ramlibacter sp. MMS24-I3-19 TaxID=3416606 RepID=UPI003D059A0F
MTRYHALRSRKSLLSFGAVSLIAMSAAAAQVAGAPGDTGIDDTGNYQHEVQACMSGQTQEARDSCLREARNAHADKQKRDLDAGATPKDRQANAMARCEPLSGEDKAACQARVLGYGEKSGSVAGGGVLREVETVVVPPGQTQVTIEPKTPNPVVLVPEQPANGQGTTAAPGNTVPSQPIQPAQPHQ